MDTNQQSRDLKNVATQKDLVYHRLDIDVHPRENLCMHLKQLSTLDAPTVFLAAGAFEVPFEYITREETKLRIQGYTAYLNDNTMLIANPGLKKGVRNSAAALSRIGAEWKQRFKMSNTSPYIVRRYIATPPGVFVVYPGTVVSKTFDPTKRPWFTKALEYPGRVVITAPYLDVGGAGYIVTISHTIFEGKAAAMHSATDQVVGVMGIDFPVGYLHKLMIDVVPFCSEPHFRCFIFDDTGYIVAHLNMIEPPLKGPIEKLHITHKEPLVANDILEHEHFVYKKLCNSFSDRTIQRFYQFNTTLSNMLTNEINRELCSRYKIVAVPGTNVFLGVVNQTCNVNTAFCPCSRYVHVCNYYQVDRLCLNCLRMEQNECECPCECPLDMDFCSGELLDTEDRNPSCSHYNEYPQPVHIDPAITQFLPRCTNNFCSGRTRQSDCVGMVDCEWCQFDADGETVLDKPFCETQRVCFGGVLGANSPYNDHVHAQARHGPPLSVRHTPVGPVAGGIMGCFLVLALAVYCYRHHVHRTGHQYICTVNDTAVHMSQLDNEIDEGDLPSEEPAAGHTNIVLSSFENPASISPYRVNTTYRRPPGGDSDHGYSTMTPHEDSEHCTPYIEPLVIGKFPRAMGSPTTSDICSMTSRSDVGGTCSDASGPSTRSELFKLPAPVSVSRSKRLQQLPTITQLPEHTVLPSSPLLAKETSTTPTGTTGLDSGTHVLVDVQVHAVDTH